MTGMPEHAHRAAEHRQPRDRRVDHTSPGFVRPPDPATGVNAGPPSDRDGAGDAPDEAKGVSSPAPVAVSCNRRPHYGDECECVARLAAVTQHERVDDPEIGPPFCRDCSAAISEWVPWADPHHPLTPADPHPHAWADLGTPGLHGSVCRLCGETQID